MPDPRPLGPKVSNWAVPAWPVRQNFEGDYARLEPLNAERHAALLYRAYQGHDHLWDYLGDGPYASTSQFHRRVREMAGGSDQVFYAVWDKTTGQLGGVASYLRIKPTVGSIEVGSINFAPVLQNTCAATEAMFLMMQWAFDAGYRRYEWKCNALNAPSRRAAQRLGFSYEGTFRQAMVMKGRNRDTAWFSVIDSEWPALREAFRAWLSRKNFGKDGRQIERLSDLTRLVRAADDPGL